MNPSLQSLVETLLWSENDNSNECGGEPLDTNYCFTDVDEACLAELYQRFQDFVSEAEQLLAAKFGDEWSSIDDFYIGCASGDYQAEHDYIMTVNEHGCGYWDGDWQDGVGEILCNLARKKPPIYAMVGDDGKIYLHSL
jgi:hypothetical protein